MTWHNHLPIRREGYFAREAGKTTSLHDWLTLPIGENEYFGTGFQVAPHATLLRPDRGSYNALHGYWIFRPDARLCWTARNANGPLDYWNRDGQAKGNPEDQELFVFEAVDANAGLVKIRNIYGAYVNYVAGIFQCTGTQAQAQVFYVANE